MRKHSLLILWLLCCSLLLQSFSAITAVADPGTYKMPLFIKDKLMPAPTWVDATIALRPDGSVDPTLFTPGETFVMDTYLKDKEVDGCVHVGKVFVDYIVNQPRRSLSEAAALGTHVLLGRVVGMSHGFEAATPATLFAVEPVSWFRGQPSEPRPRYFFVVPVGTFSLGVKTLCKSDPDFELPRMGDEVALFIVTDPYGDNQDLLEIQDPGDLVTIRGDKVLLPRKYQSPSVTSPAGRVTVGSTPALTREKLIEILAAGAKGGGAQVYANGFEALKYL